MLDFTRGTQVAQVAYLQTAAIATNACTYFNSFQAEQLRTVEGATLSTSHYQPLSAFKVEWHFFARSVKLREKARQEN
jgi:hypothetical protein